MFGERRHGAQPALADVAQHLLNYARSVYWESPRGNGLNSMQRLMHRSAHFLPSSPDFRAIRSLVVIVFFPAPGLHGYCIKPCFHLCYGLARQSALYS